MVPGGDVDPAIVPRLGRHDIDCMFAGGHLKRPGRRRKAEESRGDAWRTLVDYGMQVPVCIAWYQRQVRLKYRQQISFTVLLGVILAGTIAALVYLAFRAPAEKSPVIMAQLGLLLSGLLGAAKVVAGTIDFQKHRSGFWEAAAKLKENLYTLEGAHRGKACVESSLDAAFVEAVRLGAREARSAKTARPITIGPHRTATRRRRWRLLSRRVMWSAGTGPRSRGCLPSASGSRSAACRAAACGR